MWRFEGKCFFKPVNLWYVRPKSKNSSMSLASCLTKENNFKLNGAVYELILTYSLPIECNFNHYLAKQRFKLTEFSRWLSHLSWTAVTNYFPSTGFKKFKILPSMFCSKAVIIRNELFFCVFYRCVNSGESFKNFT